MTPSSSKKNPQYLTIQFGARRRYAVPALFQRENMGGHLVTDITGDKSLGKVISQWIPDKFQNSSIRRLAQRKVPPNIRDRTISFPLLALDMQRRMRQFTTTMQLHREYQDFSEKVSQRLLKMNLPEHTHVYSMWGEAIGFLEHQKAAGKKIVIEAFVSPETYYIVCEEGKKVSGFPELYNDELVAYERENWKRYAAVADYFIVPSDFVLETLGKENKSKALVVPYCAPPGWDKLKTAPERGRVLFTGSVSLRKGIHILGRAATRLKKKNYQFRIAGEADDQIRGHELLQDLNFLGRVLRDEMPKEFAKADVFVLPSLAEGSAEVIYEAMSMGIPIVTTWESGSVVRDGIDGFIVPSGDDKALAEAIEKIIEDRDMRDLMGENARERAAQYSWANYGKRMAHACKYFETPEF